MTVLDFKKPKTDNEPHLIGEARCLDCKHTWVARAPVGTLWLECPACTLKRGRYLERVQEPGPHWHCNCNCDLFYVTPDGYYCPNCGEAQKF